MSEATTTPTLGRVPGYIVSSRANWTDNWTAEAFVYPESIQLATGPSMSSAVLIDNYGTIKRESSSVFAGYDPIDLKNRFIRIEAVDDPDDVQTVTPLFYGFVPAEELRPHKARSGQAAGDYLATAYGLDYLLDISHYAYSVAQDAESGSGNPAGIARVIPFNERYAYGLSAIGNRTLSKVTIGAYQHHIFSDDGEVWTARDICEYVLAIHGNPRLPITLTGQVEILDNVIPSNFNPDLLKPRDIINAMIDRRRGAGWKIKVVNDVVSIDVFSVLGAAIVEGSITIPANLSPIAVDLDTVIQAEEVSLNIDTHSEYDQIVVRGARVKSVFSIFQSDGSGAGGLLPAWTTGEQASYDALDDNQRDSDSYRHVYTTYTLPRNVHLFASANPAINADGTPNFGVPGNMRRWGYTFLRQLPIAKEWSDEDAVPEFREPFAMVKDPASGRYHYADRLNTVDFPNLTLRMLDSQPGFEITGYYNHIMGLNHFDGESSKPPLFDFNDMYATVAVETDSHLYYSVTLTSPIRSKLTIDVPDAELWILSAGAVTDINSDGSLKKESVSSILRTDVDRLKGIAAAARAWYGVRRASLNLRVGYIWLTPQLGDYIVNSITGNYTESVESVVSQIVFDCINNKTTIQTAYEELDFQRLDR